MDEYILHEEYYKSIRGEDGEEPLAVHGSRPRTDLGSYTPLARRPTEPRQHPCQDDRDPSIQEHVVQPQGLPKWARLELRDNIIQGQPTVPWIIRPNCWPNFCLDQKIQM